MEEGARAETGGPVAVRGKQAAIELRAERGLAEDLAAEQGPKRSPGPLPSRQKTLVPSASPPLARVEPQEGAAPGADTSVPGYLVRLLVMASQGWR